MNWGQTGAPLLDMFFFEVADFIIAPLQCGFRGYHTVSSISAQTQFYNLEVVKLKSMRNSLQGLPHQLMLLLWFSSCGIDLIGHDHRQFRS